ncbi:MAG: MBL fold metallo-hydrolase [Treponema sp.]|jgi:glyoxylase-like metal-dependent hydrolase (beta-lactamase superfamily II)|nr:MBL fold metallo-hydrolase [Treponema sp.]
MVNRITVGELATNCWIVPIPQTGGKCILVDPGGDGDIIIARLGKLLFRPAYIALTHAHFDHIAALPDIAAAYPDAKIAIHRAEASKLGPGSLELHRRDFAAAGASSYIDAFFAAYADRGMEMPEGSVLLDEGDALGPFRVLHLPGHSPGSIGLLWEEEKILLSGDTLFRAGVGRTDLPDGDWGLLNASLERLFKLEGDIQVYPGHGETTTIGRERAR